MNMNGTDESQPEFNVTILEEPSTTDFPVQIQGFYTSRLFYTDTSILVNLITVTIVLLKSPKC